MGTKTDMKRRLTWARVDDRRKWDWFKRVRNFIYTLGKGPESQAVQDIGLGELSMKPTQVSEHGLHMPVCRKN